MKDLRTIGLFAAALTVGCSRGPARAGREVAPIDAQRIVVTPSELAVVSSHGGDGSLPAEIPFGSAVGGAMMVLLKFPTPWGNRARIASAFLTLEPSPGAPAGSQAIPIAVSRVLEHWSDSNVTWARLPKLSAVEVRALAVSGPPGTLRIDVTSIVERWTRGRADDQGIALSAAAESGVGAVYSTGVSGVPGPRLDVYLR